MIDVKRLGHAVIDTPDMAQQIDHFQDVLGLTVVGEESGRTFLATPAGQLAVVLQDGDTSQTSKLAFEMTGERSLADIQRFLSSKGFASEVRTDALPGVTTSISFQDVKGTDIELFNTWDVIPEARTIPNSVTPLKLGHVAFVVPDTQAVERFYREVLGFRTSDWIGDHFVFMRCSPDHHTVNFVRGDGPVRMHHIAFEVRDRGHLIDSCDRLGEAECDILWGPLRHGPGHNLATYHHTPDEQVIELYTEMDRVYDEELCIFEPRPWHEHSPQRPQIWEQQTANKWGQAPSAQWKR